MSNFLAKIFEPYDGPKLGAPKLLVLGLQHTFTMFGATILVPILTGLSISVALFMAGIGTLVFHLITRGKMPIFLGSSFAFIMPVIAVAFSAGDGGDLGLGHEYALGGIVVSGIVYLAFAVLVYFLGAKTILKFFPPVVTGPIIIIIGMMLAPVAIDMSSANWGLAIVSLLVVAFVSIFLKGFIKMLPVICGLVVGYLVALITGNVDFAAVSDASIFGLPDFTLAKFDFAAIMIIAPVAIATTVEHIGDVAAISATCERDFIKSPGLHRTLLGDGIASAVSAMFGGPANTTYSENTGVLALTRVFNPAVMRIAACFAILLGFMPVLSSVIATIPGAVIGGVSVVLFGMIAAVGARTLVENKVDFKDSRNLLIAAVVLTLGLGGAVLPIEIGSVSFSLQGVGLAAIVGILLNVVLVIIPEAISKKK
ncbi:MAG: NCS2 family nucleobase:cation symporter [Oscillospiraceae bacterium]|nr:NCS2 family nucleobase:cation symporter [Oscillospiraceae bacterium]